MPGGVGGNTAPLDYVLIVPLRLVKQLFFTKYDLINMQCRPYSSIQNHAHSDQHALDPCLNKKSDTTKNVFIKIVKKVKFILFNASYIIEFVGTLEVHLMHKLGC